MNHAESSVGIAINHRVFRDIAALTQKDAELLFEATRASFEERTGLCKKARGKLEHQCSLRELILGTGHTPVAKN